MRIEGNKYKKYQKPYMIGETRLPIKDKPNSKDSEPLVAPVLGYNPYYDPNAVYPETSADDYSNEPLNEASMLPEVEISALSRNSYYQLEPHQKQVYDSFETPSGLSQTVDTGPNNASDQAMHWKGALTMMDDNNIRGITNDHRGTIVDGGSGGKSSYTKDNINMYNFRGTMDRPTGVMNVPAHNRTQINPDDLNNIRNPGDKGESSYFPTQYPQRYEFSDGTIGTMNEEMLDKVDYEGLSIVRKVPYEEGTPEYNARLQEYSTSRERQDQQDYMWTVIEEAAHMHQQKYGDISDFDTKIARSEGGRPIYGTGRANYEDPHDLEYETHGPGGSSTILRNDYGIDPKRLDDKSRSGRIPELHKYGGRIQSLKYKNYQYPRNL